MLSLENIIIYSFDIYIFIYKISINQAINNNINIFLTSPTDPNLFIFHVILTVSL